MFGELADLFPGRGCTSAATRYPRAVVRSPAAQRYAGERGLAGTDAIAAAFMADVIGLVRTATGRHVGVWQEAAECGALQPDDGYVVGWRSSADCRRLAAAGFQVVAAPAEVYYLDMASDAGGGRRGRAGPGAAPSPTSRPTTSRPAGPPPSRPSSSASKPACGPSTSTTAPPCVHLLHPRLDAIAASAWTSEFRF